MHRLLVGLPGLLGLPPLSSLVSGFRALELGLRASRGWGLRGLSVFGYLRFRVRGFRGLGFAKQSELWSVRGRRLRNMSRGSEVFDKTHPGASRAFTRSHLA